MALTASRVVYSGERKAENVVRPSILSHLTKPNCLTPSLVPLFSLISTSSEFELTGPVTECRLIDLLIQIDGTQRGASAAGAASGELILRPL